MDKHDFSYVLCSAASGGLGVFLVAGIALEDRILIMFAGVCLGLALIASIVYMIHIACGPRYEPRLDENGDITLTPYGVYKIKDDQLVFDRTVQPQL